MTLEELFARAEASPAAALAYFVALPALAWLAGRLRSKGRVRDSPVRYAYSGLVFLACPPGLLAALALADILAHGRFLQAGVFSQILPLASMAATLAVIRRQADPEHIPGFRRVTGFIWLLVLTGLGVYLLTKTRIWIFFGGGVGTLLVAMAALFFLLRWAFERAFGPGR
jgi:hypothetical protein